MGVTVEAPLLLSTEGPAWLVEAECVPLRLLVEGAANPSNIGLPDPKAYAGGGGVFDATELEPLGGVLSILGSFDASALNGVRAMTDTDVESLGWIAVSGSVTDVTTNDPSKIRQ